MEGTIFAEPLIFFLILDLTLTYLLTQFIVEEYERLGSDESVFWQKYSTAEGVAMKYQEILNTLRSKRKSSHAMLAKRIKDFFHGDLRDPDTKGAFTYKKNGEVYCVEKDRDIVSRWEGLLANDSSLQTRWEEYGVILP